MAVKAVKLIYYPYVDDYKFTTLNYTIGDLGLVRGKGFITGLILEIPGG